MIEISNLSFSYGAKRVLENISLKVSEGNIYGLLGENGVGKTTLLTLLCGLKKPEAGTITVDGRNPFNREPSLLADQFYLPDEVIPVHARALDFAKEHGVFWPRFDLEKFRTILSEFEVEPQQRMDAMSAGQLKKAWISFALACNVKYYYLDEPTNGLDIPSKAQFRKAVTKYTSEDSALIISTHQVRDLENIISLTTGPNSTPAPCIWNRPPAAASRSIPTRRARKARSMSRPSSMRSMPTRTSSVPCSTSSKPFRP